MLHLLAAAALHVASRGLLLYKLGWERTCRGMSLVTQELFLLLYVCRFLDLLYLYVDVGTTVVKLLQLGVSLAVVMLMRFSPAVAETYDGELDIFPRSALIVPTLILACFANRVAMPIEIFHTFSLYLEAVVLLPQFFLLYKREKYDNWVLAWLLAAGGERLVHNAPYVYFMQQGGTQFAALLQDDPYGLLAAVVHAILFLAGVVVLVLQQLELRRQAGLNELGVKPAFDEVWDAGKFTFDEAEQGRPTTKAGSTATAERQPLMGSGGGQ